METVELAAFVAGITEVIKSLGVPSKFCPLIAILVGGVANVCLVGNYEPETVVYGLSIGLVTTGLHKVVK